MGRPHGVQPDEGGFTSSSSTSATRGGGAPPAGRASWADTPRAVAEAIRGRVHVAPGPTEVEAVALRRARSPRGLADGKVYFDLSTNSPALVRRIHEVFKRRGIHMLDAPVSGGPRGRVATPRALGRRRRGRLQALRPVLDAIGDQPTTSAPSARLSGEARPHCAGYIIQTALAEVFTMGVKAGVEPIALWKAVRQGAGGRRRTFDGLADQFLPANSSRRRSRCGWPQGRTLATALGREHKVPMRSPTSRSRR